MSVVEHVIGEGTIGPRDPHNGRVFVDIAESVHVHYREMRLVFDVEEFRAFAKAVAEGAANLETAVAAGYATQSDEFCRSGRQTKAKIIGGSLSRPMSLPKPTRSAYFDDRVVVERNRSNERDRYHVHYRDFRIAFNNRQNFESFRRIVGSTGGLPIEAVSVATLKSVYAANRFDREWIDKGSPDLSQPLLVTSDGFIADGHHRWQRALRDSVATLPAIRLPLTFEQTKPLRFAERQLKLLKDWTLVEQHRRLLVAMFVGAADQAYPSGT